MSQRFPAEHWSLITETTAVTGIRLLYFFYRLGGRPLFWLSVWPVLVVYWAALPAMRRVSLGYLRHAYAAGLLKKKAHGLYDAATLLSFCRYAAGQTPGRR